MIMKYPRPPASPDQSLSGLPWEWNFYSHSHPIPTGFLWGSLLENFNIFSFKARSAEDKHTTTALRLLFGPHVTRQPGKRSALVNNYNKMGAYYILYSRLPFCYNVWPKQQPPQSGCCMFVLGTSCLKGENIEIFQWGSMWGSPQ